MEWSGGAVVGFTSAGKFYQNYNLSGTPSVKNIACLNSPESEWTNIIYQLSKHMPMHFAITVWEVNKLHVGDNYIPFLELGHTSGVTRNYLQSVVNSSSGAIDIPEGFSLGTSNQTLVYVGCTQKFGHRVILYCVCIGQFKWTFLLWKEKESEQSCPLSRVWDLQLFGSPLLVEYWY